MRGKGATWRTWEGTEGRLGWRTRPSARRSSPAVADFEIRSATGSVMVTAGGVATLRVDAAGEGLVYQWYEGARGDIAKPLSESGSPRLHLNISPKL